ncbi:MAG: hypothetical protein Q7J16_04115 [Candidatus Cloacimonadales bacterium]|nr:hypothetical protein [Candidatus Cloacimonadales bacterium]
MKRFLLFSALALLIFGCDTRTSNPEDEVWSRVQVYENGVMIHEEVLDAVDDSTFVVLDLLDGSQIALDKYVNIVYPVDPTIGDEEIDRDYVILVEKEDYFTRFYSCSYQDTIIIDAVSGYSPIPSSVICGTIFTRNHYMNANNSFFVLQDSVIICNIITNAFGHFSNDSLSFGNYQIIEEEYYPDGFTTDFDVNNFYDDYLVDNIIYAAKPNIYIYPTETIALDVALSFPNNGNVITSIPEYGSGWENLHIDPSGKINDANNYLFYESVQPDLYQYKHGWLVQREELEIFFIQNLTTTGFDGQEIIDFTDFWIPLLKDYPFYAIYPQYNDQLSEMTKLEFSIEPDNLLRLIYAIEGQQNDSLVLTEPKIPEFQREGFFVVEWGVSLKSSELLSLNKTIIVE